MNKLFFLLPALMVMLLTFSGCSHEDPPHVIWEVADYDSTGVKVVISDVTEPAVYIDAMSDYSGEITLRCVNYHIAGMNGLNVDNMFVLKGGGFSVERINESTLVISIPSYENFDADDSFASFWVNCVNGKESNSSKIYIKRILNQH